jgi:Cupin-like domain
MVDHISAMRVFPPDATAYPLFANAVYAEVLLEPGEMLYIPRRWWHWVTSYDRNIALSIWHAADRRTMTVPLDAGSVSRIDAVTEPSELGSRYFPAKEPVVIRADHVRRWPAFTGWTDDYLRAAIGGKEHYVGISPDPHLQAIKGDHRTRAEVMSFDEFLDRSATSPEYHYLGQDDATPGLLQSDWSIPDFWRDCFTDDEFRTAFWFTNGREQGLTSSLHFDYYENLLAQIAGRKRVLLFSRSQTPYLYRKQEEFIGLTPRAVE